jgi:F0F1-type ATP synthase assembly protein I
MSDPRAEGGEERTPEGRRPSGHEQIGEAVGHTVETAAFFGSLMAGLLLGWVADHFLETRPAFIIVGIVAGASVGFWRMWVNYTGEGRRGR